MPSNEDDENENEDVGDETMSQYKKNIRIKQLNDCLDKIIDKSKLFKDQIKSTRKLKNREEYWYFDDHGDKELKFRIFKIRLAHLLNVIHEKLFEQIFGHALQTLANKLINTTNKEENKIIVNNLNKNKEKLYETDHSIKFVIQPSDQHIDLNDAIKLILDFNETI